MEARHRVLPFVAAFVALELACHRAEQVPLPDAAARAPAESDAAPVVGGPRVDILREAAEFAPCPDGVDLATATFQVERMTCEGSCPSYTVSIDGKGGVRYVGRLFVKTIGERTEQISEAVRRELVERFCSAKFFELEDSYIEPVSHVPIVLLTFGCGTREKRVWNGWPKWPLPAGYEPSNREIHERLDALTLAVETAVDIEQWIGTEAERRDAPAHFIHGADSK